MQIRQESWAPLRVRCGLGAASYGLHDNMPAAALYLRELDNRHGRAGFRPPPMSILRPTKIICRWAGRFRRRRVPTSPVSVRRAASAQSLTPCWSVCSSPIERSFSVSQAACQQYPPITAASHCANRPAAALATAADEAFARVRRPVFVALSQRRRA
jgi:hypothetical protein